MLETQEVLDWRGRDMVDPDGYKIGQIEAIYLDTATELPEWALVETGGTGTFVPLAQAIPEGGVVRVPHAKAQVEGAPTVEPGVELSQDAEARLYSHYGLVYGEARSDTGLPEGEQRPTGTATTDDAMTRSEEELRVGTVRRETGRLRLRKYVVTENVQATVPVAREEVRLEREPITEANIGDATTGPELSEEEHEVTLHAEEPVIEKNVVPKERVRLDKDVVVEGRQIDEDVRKEQIDVEGGPA